jgi:hypothetical protein
LFKLNPMLIRLIGAPMPDPFDLELGISLLGLTVGEIGNRVIALHRKGFVVSIDGGLGIGNDCQRWRKRETAGSERNGCKRYER